MDIMLFISAIIIFLVGIAHTYLGEKLLLVRILRFAKLERIYKERTPFVKQVLRFGWHLPTIAWWGIAATYIVFSINDLTPQIITILRIFGVMFLVHGIMAIVITRAKHLSWPAFLAVAVLSFLVS